MVFSLLLVNYDDFHIELGILIIIFALVSLVSVGGGNGVGFLLAVVGGAFAIAFGPEQQYVPRSRAPVAPAPESPISPSSVPLNLPGAGGSLSSEAEQHSVAYRGCTKCGRATLPSHTFCPNCGARF